MLETIIQTIEYGQVVSLDENTFNLYFSSEEELNQFCLEREYVWIKQLDKYLIFKEPK